MVILILLARITPTLNTTCNIFYSLWQLYVAMGDNSNSTATTTQSHGLSSGHRTVSLKLFASWEIDKTSSSCIPR